MNRSEVFLNINGECLMDVITFLQSYDYGLCLAKGNRWSLEEAVDYLAAYIANKQTWRDRDDTYKEFLSIRGQISDALQYSINAGKLTVDEEAVEGGGGEEGIICSEIDFKKSTITPLVFIEWAIDNNIEVPKQYEKYAVRNRNDKSVSYEGISIKKTCIHHERCRAVAELLWSREPDISIADMARRSEIVQFGCEGHKYDMRTISRWLASLKFDRKPGRRKKTG